MSSSSLLRYPLHFPKCLCFSPVLVISPPPPPPAFTLDVLGFDSVIRVATSAVPAVAPPLFRPFVSVPGFQLAAVPAAPYSLSLHAVATAGSFGLPPRSSFCGYGCPFLSSSAFPHAASPATPFAFGTAPVIFLAVPRGSGASIPCVYTRFLSSGFRRMLSFTIGLFPQAVFSPLVSPPRACLRCSSIWLRFLFSRSALPYLCNKIVSLVLMTLSNLRFPSRRGLPLGRVRVAVASVLSVFGVTSCGGILSVLISASFLGFVSSSVLLVTCSPFGLRLASFGALSG